MWGRLTPVTCCVHLTSLGLGPSAIHKSATRQYKDSNKRMSAVHRIALTSVDRSAASPCFFVFVFVQYIFLCCLFLFLSLVLSFSSIQSRLQSTMSVDTDRLLGLDQRPFGRHSVFFCLCLCPIYFFVVFISKSKVALGVPPPTSSISTSQLTGDVIESVHSDSEHLSSDQVDTAHNLRQDLWCPPHSSK